jgi:hypothetical protein
MKVVKTNLRKHLRFRNMPKYILEVNIIRNERKCGYNKTNN